MNIKILETTVFESGANAIVNTVNCVGFMGGGLALEFKLRYPKMYDEYKKNVENNNVKIGKLTYHQEKDIKIINFPTKDNFRDPSKIEYIEKGLNNFIKTYQKNNIKSIAFPKLGAGLGGLNWKTVRNLIIRKLKDLPIKVYICEDTLPPIGVEKKMIDFIRDYNLLNLELKSNLYAPLEKNISTAKRFYEIKSKGVGINTYEKVFKVAYDYAMDREYPDTYKRYSNHEKNNIYHLLITSDWNDLLNLTDKQYFELKKYLSTVRHSFSFYEFLASNKPHIKKIRDFIEKNENDTYYQMSIFDT